MPRASAKSEYDFLPASARVWAPYLILALVVFAAYGNIFDGEFLFDDIGLIALNAHLRDWSHIGNILTSSTASGANLSGGFFRPLQMLLYLFAFQLGNGDVFWFHALNLALHMANTCLVFKLGTKLRFDARSVFLAALAWGVHPLHTEAVTYISGTADPLFVFFCLWAIIILSPDFTPRKIIKIIPLFLLGLASKETAVVLPPLVMVCLFYISPKRLKLRTYYRTWPLWIIALAYTYWRWNTGYFTGPQSTDIVYSQLPALAETKAFAHEPLYRFFTFLATLPSYFRLLVWPVDLHMERNFPIYSNFWYWPVISGALLMVLAFGYFVYSLRAKRQLALCWGLLWFAAAHAPHTGLLVLMNALLLEHWMYLPTIGLFLGLGQAIRNAVKPMTRAVPVFCFVAALALCAALSVKTYEQNKVWRNHVSFYTNILSYEKNAARAHSNLATYYINHGQYDDAFEHLNLAIAASDVHAEARYSLASVYLHKTFRKEYPAADSVVDIYKQPYTFVIPRTLTPQEKEGVTKAIENLNRSIEIQPDYFRSYQTLGDIYELVLKDKDKAKYYHDRAKALFRSGQ